MDIASIINRLYMFVGYFIGLLVLVFLTIAVIYRRRCWNFSTLLACNTAVAICIYSFDNAAAATYMYFWDQQVVPEIYSLCSLRAFIHHAAMAAVHHSFVLKAIDKYVKIKRLTLLDSYHSKVLLFLIQWGLDLGFV